jgi:hypothetical protein
VTIALAGVHGPAVHVITDRAGNFSYAINQDHVFFRAGPPPGTYRVVVTDPGGARAVTSFLVNGG